MNIKHVSLKIAKSLMAMNDDTKKKEALAKFLNCDVDDVVYNSNWEIFEYLNKEYFVLTREESFEKAKQSIISLFEDLGTNAFNKKNVNIDDFINKDYRTNDMYDYYESYCSDILNENADKFENRLIEECYQNKIISDNDFARNGNKIDYYNCLIDNDKLIDKYTEFLYEQDNYYDWAIDLGYTIEDILKSYPDIIDLDALTNYCINMDGVAHFIASYDGKVNKQDEYYIYRVN